MTDIYSRSERIKQRWRDRAEEDPLTGLPNLRALEGHLRQSPRVVISSLRIENLDFLSRHYGMMMRVECKRQIARRLQPLLDHHDKIYQLPGSELLLVIEGPEPAARLNHIVSMLNHAKFNWHNQDLDLEFGAAWGVTAALRPNYTPCLASLAGYRSRLAPCSGCWR